jgi:hypothetical protein
MLQLAPILDVCHGGIVFMFGTRSALMGSVSRDGRNVEIDDDP